MPEPTENNKSRNLKGNLLYNKVIFFIGVLCILVWVFQEINPLSRFLFGTKPQASKRTSFYFATI